MSDSELGAFVRGRREELGLAQEEVARRTGITQATLSNLERGRTRMPSPDHRRRLAAALGIGHVDLLLAAGEVAPDELEAWGRKHGAAIADGGTDWWGASVVPRLREEPAGSPRARLVEEATRLTLREAGVVLRLVEGLPSEAADRRRTTASPDKYRRWRDSTDALEVL